MLEQQKIQGISLEELSERYSNEFVFEYVSGQEITIGNFTLRQEFIVRRFAKLLRQHVTESEQVWGFGVWPFAIVDEDDFVVASLVPDLMFYSNETWETYLQTRSTTYIEKPIMLVPEMVIEVLDNDEKYSHTMRKVDFYLENGVLLVWLFDIERKVVVEHSYLYPEGYTFRIGASVSGGDIAPTLEFLVSDVFDVEDEMPNLTYNEVVKLAKDYVSKNKLKDLEFDTVIYVDESKTPYWHAWFARVDKDGNTLMIDPSAIYVRIIDATAEVSIPPQF